MKEKIIITESDWNAIGRNYNKAAILREVMRGKKPVIIDDGEEYKSIRDIMKTDEKENNNM